VTDSEPLRPLIKFDLDPEIEAFIETSLRVSSNLSTDGSIEQQRQSSDAACRYFFHGYPDKVEAVDEKVVGRHGDINVRHYCYDGGNPDSDDQIVFMHGGGFILGSLDSHDDICAELCAGTGLDAVSIDYRLAPEFLHPVHLDDVADAYLKIWRTNSILVGVSAGANLAAALCHRLKTSDTQPAGQVLIYPTLGGELFNLDSYTINANAPLLSSADVDFYRQVRCRDGETPVDDPEFYPLVAKDFNDLPPTVAFSADVDPLRDDSKLYVEKLKDAGVDAVWHNETGLVHSYLWARHTSSKAAESFRRIIGSINILTSSS
jgi:acetyl esterase